MDRCSRCGKKLSRGSYNCIYCGNLNKSSTRIISDSIEYQDIDELSFSFNNLFYNIYNFPKKRREWLIILVSYLSFFILIIFKKFFSNLNFEKGYLYLIYNLPFICFLIGCLIGTFFYYDYNANLFTIFFRNFCVSLVFLLFAFPVIIVNSLCKPEIIITIFSLFVYTLFFSLIYFFAKFLLWKIMLISGGKNYLVFISITVVVFYFVVTILCQLCK